MNILIACEVSQEITKRFLRKDITFIVVISKKQSYYRNGITTLAKILLNVRIYVQKHFRE